MHHKRQQISYNLLLHNAVIQFSAKAVHSYYHVD